MSIWNTLFGFPEPDPVPADYTIRADADAPPYDQAHPDVRHFYNREAYEAIRTEAKRKEQR